jgi:hypothetical protein
MSVVSTAGYGHRCHLHRDLAPTQQQRCWPLSQDQLRADSRADWSHWTQACSRCWTICKQQAHPCPQSVKVHRKRDWGVMITNSEGDFRKQSTRSPGRGGQSFRVLGPLGGVEPGVEFATLNNHISSPVESLYGGGGTEQEDRLIWWPGYIKILSLTCLCLLGWWQLQLLHTSYPDPPAPGG